MAFGAKTLAELGFHGQRPLAITGLSVDSRLTREGHLFAALPGTKSHGAEFVPMAVRMGAVAVLTDAQGAQIIRAQPASAALEIILSDDPRQTLAYTAALFFGAQPATMVAVTGTNGKTSVASFTRQIWALLGEEAVNIGTTGVEGAYSAPSAHTTPEPITLHRLLADMAVAGVTHGAMEASSHGLEQRRLDGVRLKAAAFTNFTQDHLDYHATFDAYFAAKAGLFTRVLSEDGVAVINLDDPAGSKMADIARARGQDVLAVGQSEWCDLRFLAARYDATGQDLRFSWKGAPYLVRLPLIGGFQASNILVACGLVIASGAEPEAVFATLPKLATVRGRMQLAALRDTGAAVFVDYAHTPDAVETALKALRPHVLGRIIVVLGAGGDRDTSKRPLMGKAAAENADLVFVTDDNPRSEEPSAIRAMVLSGARAVAGAQVYEVGDRAEAILRGVDALTAGDALLIAGKGHETGQIIGTDIYPFDDVEQASVAVAALDGRI